MKETEKKKTDNTPQSHHIFSGRERYNERDQHGCPKDEVLREFASHRAYHNKVDEENSEHKVGCLGMSVM